ncbi:uncharacterized protein BO66DRAFT_454303 [Aspergillus aculeatinus CBS 121060]|uniref:Uncharacterized protein n=1 Tax=Aspergillus aculeatinus CBS 121060 TaxID=1448322 RepID=A0ACD1H5Q2_9EURO|nr:hypothetical protein BO66DRAFT_454303 [Aspergillus aculeatinus CBS 121060]RAH68909.1 hypothetical protein BO66DRAFT_454303 [Aspergillus aculeatinus CBS 121060]
MDGERSRGRAASPQARKIRASSIDASRGTTSIPLLPLAMSESGDQLKRKRARVACEPCRQRKRKCNGATPCATCTDWGYNCHYTDQTPRKPAVGGESLRSPDEAVTQSHHHQGIARSLEANSAAAFVRKMGLKVDPAQAPKLALFGWNIGARQLPSGTGAISARPIVDVISVADMKQLAEVYFTKIDPCYGFIDRRVFDDRLKTRWQTPLSSGSIYDSILAGVAALGSLFSHRSMTITELHLVEAARSILDGHDGSGPPSLELVTGWALRVVYMRMTAAPHATWIASSTLMHLIEAAGLHLEPSSSSSATSHDTVPLRAPATTPPHDREISRRLVGVAHHLNIWTSFDLGLSRVAFRTGLPLPASPTNPGDYTPEVLNLLPASACLDPENSQTDSDLEPTLTKVLQGTHTQPPSVMAQTNLVLCILRRLRILNLSITPQVTDQVLVLFGQALSYARTMVTDGSPWHQVANVPMQILYVLLEMDTRASLAMLPAAMQTVTLVATTYDTATMREAYSTARLLVSLYQQRRSEDTRVLAEVLNLAPGAGETVTEPLSPRVDELSWLEGLVAEMPSLQGLELEPWLQGDVLAGGEGWE